MLLNFFRAQQRHARADILSGLTVALALIPEAVAFAFVLGVSPVIGLYSAFFVGLIAAIFGGRPGMISGATGAMAVVVVSLVAIHGIEYLFPTVILCGLIQVLVGIGRLGKLIRMVPQPVMLGFVNGLAIVIFMSQIDSFKVTAPLGTVEYLRGPALAMMLGLVALTMMIIWLLPKITRAVPASLVAILVVSGLAFLGNSWLDRSLAPPGNGNVVLTVGDLLMNNERAATAARELARDGEASEEAVLAAIAAIDPQTVTLAAGAPRLFFLEYVVPPIEWQTLMIIAPFAFILAAVGLIESLMTMTLIDEITETRGQGNRECIGQGAANITCGLFGGMGGCAMIGQSLINVNSGGRGRLSGIVAAVSLLFFMLFCSSWIELIPIAALVGVMFMVVIGTFEWASLRMFGRMPGPDMLVMVVVAGYTAIMHDLATAVVIGVILSALSFAWEQAKHIGVDIKVNRFGAKIYQLHGPLFFASTTTFKQLFDPAEDPAHVVIDFYYTRVYDQSGLEAINGLAERYAAHEKHLHLTHLSPECRELLGKAKQFVVVNLSEDPQYHVASDRLA